MYKSCYLYGALEPLLLRLKVLVEPPRPVSDDPDVKADGVALLRRRADGEGVPLERGDGRDVDEDVVAGLEGKVGRPLDDQGHHLGGEDDAGGHPGLALVGQALGDPADLLDGKHHRRHDEPLPKVGRVDDQDAPVQDVQEVRPVEYLEKSQQNNAHFKIGLSCTFFAKLLKAIPTWKICACVVMYTS